MLEIARPRLRSSGHHKRLEALATIVAEFNAGAAQVVFLSLRDFEERLAAPILTAGEAERARRLIAPTVRHGFLGGRYLLRSVLATLTGVEPASLELQAGSHGKPILAGHERLEASFNLSHSGDLVALALVRARRVGIDIEAERPLADAGLLARRIFSVRERERFEALPEHHRRSALLEAWTRKEAVLKAMGTGVSGGLKTVEVVSNTVVTSGEMPASWSVLGLAMPTGFCGAIAIEGTLPRIVTWQAVPHLTRSA